MHATNSTVYTCSQLQLILHHIMPLLHPHTFVLLHKKTNVCFCFSILDSTKKGTCDSLPLRIKFREAFIVEGDSRITSKRRIDAEYMCSMFQLHKHEPNLLNLPLYRIRVLGFQRQFPLTKLLFMIQKATKPRTLKIYSRCVDE